MTKIIFTIATLSLVFQIEAKAHLDDRAVESVDAERERNLGTMVREFGQAELKNLQCQGNNGPSDIASPVMSVLKLESDSQGYQRDSENFEYRGTYLVIKKCPMGTTMAGAFLDFSGGVYVRASFDSRKPMSKAKISVLKHLDRADLSGVLRHD